MGGVEESKVEEDDGDEEEGDDNNPDWRFRNSASFGATLDRCSDIVLLYDIRKKVRGVVKVREREDSQVV